MKLLGRKETKIPSHLGFPRMLKTGNMENLKYSFRKYGAMLTETSTEIAYTYIC